jgi:geranylgeranyl pyrophosphate synthase
MVATTVSKVDTIELLNRALPSIKKDIGDLVANTCGKHHMPPVIAGRVSEYYKRCLDYNIVGGKLARARTVCETVRFCHGPNVTELEARLDAAVVLGWAVEILQAFFLI